MFCAMGRKVALSNTFMERALFLSFFVCLDKTDKPKQPHKAFDSLLRIDTMQPKHPFGNLSKTF